MRILTMNKKTIHLNPPYRPSPSANPWTPPKHSDLYLTLKKRRTLRAASKRNRHTEAYATLFICALALAYFIITLAIH